MGKNLVEVFREAVKTNAPTVVTGSVVDTDPVLIRLVGDSSILLSAQSLIIPSGQLPLKAGELFYMLAINDAKVYYILDRV